MAFRPVRALAALLALSVLAGGTVACGGGDDEAAGGEASTMTQAPASQPADFPRGAKTLRGLRTGMPEGPVLAPAVSMLDTGENRFSFALFDTAQQPIEANAVAVYTAETDGSDLRGPYPAREESLAVKPQFQSRQTAADADEVKSFYVAEVPFSERGSRIVTALVHQDDDLVAASQIEVRVGVKGGPPDVGEKAIPIHTPTVADAGGDLSKIDTRQPPLPSLHDADFAEVLGQKPIVLGFATPQLCQTRVCGPVVDIMAQVQAQTEGVEFIHMEIYRDNRLDRGFRPQVAKWRLPTEPWTFVIDRDGRIVERFEGAVSVAELERAVEKVA